MRRLLLGHKYNERTRILVGATFCTFILCAGLTANSAVAVLFAALGLWGCRRAWKLSR